MPQSSDTVLCPSAPALPGAILLGRFGADGNLDFLSQTIEIDSSFIDASHEAGAIPEEHYRFSSPCLKKGLFRRICG